MAVALMSVTGAGACAGAQGAGATAQGASATAQDASATTQGASATAQGASATAQGASATASATAPPPDEGDITSLPYRLRIDDVHVDEPLAPALDLVESVTTGVH